MLRGKDFMNLATWRFGAVLRSSTLDRTGKRSGADGLGFFAGAVGAVVLLTTSGVGTKTCMVQA